ncbi:MAG: hypothetical protein NTX36_05885, partial [Proteobacteria bacterium]|nr:hypothetical protein [Pseudomonadota bacterium]
MGRGAEDRRQKSEDRRQKSGGRKQGPGNSKFSILNALPSAGLRLAKSAIRNPKSEIRNPQSAIGLSVLSGILLILIQPPISLFPLAYVSLIPLIHSLKGNNIRHNFLMGFITGVVSHIGHIY